MARPRTDIEPRIVHAARARFLAEGVDGASLREIARDAKTSVGMVFYYFPAKDDLFLAVVEEVYARLLEDLAVAFASAPTARERLTAAFSRLGRATDDELQVIRLVAREALLSSERFHKILARTQRGHFPMILETLLGGVAGGEIDASIPLPMLLVCTMALGGLPQLLRRTVADELPFAALPKGDDLARACVTMLFRAIGAPPATAAREPAKRAVAKKTRRPAKRKKARQITPG